MAAPGRGDRSRPDAAHVVRSASFEEVFFTIKHIGLADSLDLLALVSGKHIRGFIDLDCWRKDVFVRKPFMEWITAFIQAGAEELAGGAAELCHALEPGCPQV